MPAFRIASALAYYIRCREILDAHQAINAALTSSNYSPDALGLSAAAHARGLSVIYVNHAPVPQNSPVVPPVLADCSVFNGDAARETYARRSRYLSETVLIGLPGAAKPFSLRDEVAAIGIFLTALTRTETIERLVDELRDSSPGIRILIRHHPVALLETDLSTMTARHNGIEVTLGTPLDDDITACDLIFCGNSGAALDVLRGGCPVAYLPELDRLPVDFNGFLEDGLVPRVDGWSPGLYASLKSFYGAPDWADRMRKHDASYGVSREELEAAARVRLVTHLSGQSSVERLDFRAEAIGAGSAQRHLPASSIPHQDQDGCSKYSLG